MNDSLYVSSALCTILCADFGMDVSVGVVFCLSCGVSVSSISLPLINAESMEMLFSVFPIDSRAGAVFLSSHEVHLIDTIIAVHLIPNR